MANVAPARSVVLQKSFGLLERQVRNSKTTRGSILEEFLPLDGLADDVAEPGKNGWRRAERRIEAQPRLANETRQYSDQIRKARE